jgi:hypothetical protein
VCQYGSRFCLCTPWSTPGTINKCFHVWNVDAHNMFSGKRSKRLIRCHVRK